MGLAGKLAAAAAGASVVLSGNAARADATPTGIEVGLRSGYAIPMGYEVGALSNQAAPKLSEDVSGMIPIWVDAGYRLTPNIMLGAYFQYGIAFISNDDPQPGGSPPCSKIVEGGCSAYDLMFGAQVHYHFAPEHTIDPWVGLGVGYEILTLKASEDTGDPQNPRLSGSESFTGFQFVDFQVGGDYEVMPNFGVGPFVMFSLGEYSGCSATAFTTGAQAPSCTIPITALHEWLTLGIRGAYDINL